jgi:hypothetical protein
MYLIVTNGNIRPGLRYATEAQAAAHRASWQALYSQYGLELTSFETVEFNPFEPSHQPKIGRAIIVGIGSGCELAPKPEA